jgi:hypothetical protein
VTLPSGISQLSPVQQSAAAVQAPFRGWQTAGAAQLPPEQIPEQHCAPESHATPLAEQLPPAVPPSGMELMGT